MNKLLEKEHYILKEKIEEYIAGNIKYPDLKKYSAPFGIYKQRNDMFMVRIRITGGELSLVKYKAIVNIVEKYNIGYIHFSTRQAVQLHDIDPAKVFDIVTECTENEMYFKGGGGDTVRNVAVCYYSGLTENSVFDVMPHAKALASYFYNYLKAYNLPRKIKFAFSCNSNDDSYAKYHDLGFIAKYKDGQKGFEVYAGGGMGRNSSAAVKILDFINEDQFINCAVAATDIFYEHGNRENRNKARLRYVCNSLGEDKFIELFNNYYNEISNSKTILPEEKLTYDYDFSGLNKIEKSSVLNPNDFNKWKKLAAIETVYNDIKLLKLFVPYGVVSIDEAKLLLDIVEKINTPFIRLTRCNDIFIPVNQDQLQGIYGLLESSKDIIDFKADSLEGLITSCIGAKICTVGVIDPKPFAESISGCLEGQLEDKEAIINNFINTIKISGCPNCCSNHPVSKIGLQGCKKKDSNGESIPHMKLCADQKIIEKLGYENETFLKTSDMSEFVNRFIKKLL